MSEQSEPKTTKEQKPAKAPVTIGKRGAIRFEGKGYYARVWVLVNDLPENGERVQLRYFETKDN